MCGILCGLFKARLEEVVVGIGTTDKAERWTGDRYKRISQQAMKHKFHLR